MAEQHILGNTQSVKASVLSYMEEFLGKSYSPGSFFPAEIVEMMTAATLFINREVAVYLDRKNRVVSISIGDDRSVALPETDGRKSEVRLCGIRLLHTHPNGSVYPSDVDLTSLKKMRLDAMAVIGVRAGAVRTESADAVRTESADTEFVMKQVTGYSAAVLVRNAEGLFTETELIGPYHRLQAGRFDQLFHDLNDTDKTAPERLIQLETGPERAILVGLVPPEKSAADESLLLNELRELAESAGALVVGQYVQKRAAPDSKYYIGKGLAEELSLQRQAGGADLIIFDDELSASQVRNLEDITGVRVIDRTTLILDIFAARAKSREGRLQVELAQQKYRLPRLMGQGTALSRLGGGIGTRGPGETKLQSDRRHINRRIHYLETQLKEVSKQRGMLRKERNKKAVPVIAVVGYTNAGKSTLVNSLCHSDVFVEDKVFATLDPSVRKLATSDKKDFLIVDTVGFIRKLPHDLVEAFRSTLEEAVYADLLLHVADVSMPDWEERMTAVEQTLRDIGAGNRPRYLVLNKTDKLRPEEWENLFHRRDGYGKVFQISAAAGTGLEALREAVIQFFTRVERKFTCVIPYDRGGLLSFIHTNGTVTEESYGPDGVQIKGTLPAESIGRILPYTTQDRS